ncbi:MAG: hypothetical protein Q8P72_03235 [Candidatus Roizmanbacteria bacterium]|nr:hypothetical protein [Candidatus Roizmanbacteria bacterium]
MDKQLARYIRNHIVFVTSVVIVGFTLLAAGEYYLYRQIMYINKMVSEGFMQIKSEQDISDNNSEQIPEVNVVEDANITE